MEPYLRSLPDFIANLAKGSFKRLNVVIGNESCDLDSAACAAVYAHSIHSIEKPAIPILNILREDLPLKTDVTFCFGKDLANHIPCRDDIKWKDLDPEELDLFLVDHHVLTFGEVSPFKNRLSKVFDHRPFSADADIPSTAEVILRQTGSCSTLIGGEVLAKGYNDPMGLRLLRDTILTDTINLSEAAKKTTPEDVEILTKIEVILETTTLEPRDSVFNQICDAKTDISQLTFGDLLRKDLKVFDVNNSFKVAVPSAMLTFEELAQRGDSNEIKDDLGKFCSRYDADLVVIMGVSIRESDLVARDLFIYDNKASGNKCENLCRGLVKDQNLGLEEHMINNLDFGTHFKQGNLTFNRKKVWPIVQEILNK